MTHAGRLLRARRTGTPHVRAFFSRNFSRFRMPKPRNLVAKRNADSTESYADVVRVAQRTQRTPGEFVNARCTKIEQNLRRVCAFSCENLHDFEPVTQQISAPNAALTLPTAFPTSLLLRSSRSARRPSFACGGQRGTPRKKKMVPGS